MICAGISTRVLSAALSQHGDDRGLILPPMIARYQVVIVPIVMKKEQTEALLAKAEQLKELLTAADIRSTIDSRDLKPGDKFYHWEMKGVPIRIEVGPRDLQQGTLVMSLRTSTPEEKKETFLESRLVEVVATALETQMTALREKSRTYANDSVVTCSTVAEMKAQIKKGGFARVPFHSSGMDGKRGDALVHEACGGEVRGFVAGEEAPPSNTTCIVTGEPAVVWGYVARSY